MRPFPIYLRQPPAIAFLSAGLVTFVLSTTVADVFARVTIGHQTPTEAFSESLYWSAVQTVGTFMLLAPFLAIAHIALSTAQKSRRSYGVVHLTVFMSILAWMYFPAYQASQGYMLEKMWTAATLSIGLLPFRAIPLIGIAFLARWLIVRFAPAS